MTQNPAAIPTMTPSTSATSAIISEAAHIQAHVDARGLKCPMPVIKLQQALRTLELGEKVQILCTDPGAEKDIASWCKVNKHQLLQTETFSEQDDAQPIWQFTVVKQH